MPRAAALQMLHPAIAAAAEQHSRFPGSLWAQQARAVPRVIGVVYQDDASGERVRQLHEDIKGRDEQGRRYHSLAPDVFFWEHATFVDALMTAIDLFDRPLSGEEREHLYQESRIWYRRYGVSDRVVPPDYGSCVDYFDAVCRQVLEVNSVFDVYFEEILRPDAWLPRLLPAGLVPVLLPQSVRHLLGLMVSSADERRFRRFAWTVRLSWQFFRRLGQEEVAQGSVGLAGEFFELLEGRPRPAEPILEARGTLSDHFARPAGASHCPAQQVWLDIYPDGHHRLLPLRDFIIVQRTRPVPACSRCRTPARSRLLPVDGSRAGRRASTTSWITWGRPPDHVALTGTLPAQVR